MKTVVNYTEELTQKIISEYEASPTRETVDALSKETGKSVRSIIAKLSSAGVYKTPQRTTKTGDEIVRKEELAADIGEWLGIEVPSLIKAAKLELRALHAALKERLCIQHS